MYEKFGMERGSTQSNNFGVAAKDEWKSKISCVSRLAMLIKLDNL